MIPGAGEVLLILLFAFIVFGPRKKGPAPTLGRRMAVGAAVVAPSLLVMDLAGAALGLPRDQVAWLALAAVGASAVSVALAALVGRYLDRKH